MRTRQLKLGRPDLSAQVEQRFRQEKDSRSKVRLLCIKLAARGEHSAEEIANICGASRASVFEWIKAFREGGFESLLQRGKPGPRGGEFRGLPEKAAQQLREGVQSGRWTTAEAARRWLLREHKVEKPYGTVWQWIKKCGGVAAGCCDPATPEATPQRRRPSKRNSERALKRSGSRPGQVSGFGS